MREAVIAARAALARMRDQIGVTQRELEVERRQLADAERRGRLAAEIGDQETVAVARHFAARHGERAGVLERKLRVQQDEAALLERELSEMTEQLERALEQRSAPGEGTVEAAQVLEQDPEEVLKARLDRAAREAQAEQQLEALKRKLGKRGRS